MSVPVRLVLASGSPRRRELLARLGLEFDVLVPEVDESIRSAEGPDTHVRRVASEKAETIAARCPGRPVLAADTMVIVDGEALGKPTDTDAARTMLRRLSGRTHEVLTAVHLCYAGASAGHLERAAVRFALHSDELIEWYLATGEPADKAGGYAVQGRGALLVERIEGNVQAVVGLPLAPLPALFASVGLRLCPVQGRLALLPVAPGA